ncbi:helix-turn-helix domain-containing protein [Photobacterium nomapromontoriensis]|uniref:helix-turn-helix domain-containing protein n=1 Tax=Photobacterium nomapromontoriensis TaxID=2910237 RepID=UPI003D126955
MNEHILKPFGNHIKSLRLECELSQEELAARCSLDRTYISGIERGRRNVSLVNIFRLATALNTPPSQLLNFEVGVADE